MTSWTGARVRRWREISPDTQATATLWRALNADVNAP